jgi:hypothetical protein
MDFLIGFTLSSILENKNGRASRAQPLGEFRMTSGEGGEHGPWRRVAHSLARTVDGDLS